MCINIKKHATYIKIMNGTIVKELGAINLISFCLWYYNLVKETATIVRMTVKVFFLRSFVDFYYNVLLVFI